MISCFFAIRCKMQGPPILEVPADLRAMEIPLKDMGNVIVLNRLYLPQEVREDVHSRAIGAIGVGQGTQLVPPTTPLQVA